MITIWEKIWWVLRDKVQREEDRDTLCLGIAVVAIFGCLMAMAIVGL